MLQSSAEPYRGPLLVNGLLIAQRPGVDPLYDGPAHNRGEDPASIPPPSPAQLQAANRVVDDSKDPEGVLKLLQGNPLFQRISSSEDRYAVNLRPYPLMMPEHCMYGTLGDLTRKMESPLGWAYSSLLALYAGQGINLSDRYPSVRPTLFVALMGGVGDGKSATLQRAQRILDLTPEQVETNVAVSDRGILNTFRKGLDKGETPTELRPGVMVIDEMLALLRKMGYSGSTLSQTMCEMYYNDRVGVTDKNGTCEINARVSLVGNLKLANREEFQEVFAGNTQDGFYSRMILVPGPTEWRIDHSWRPPSEPEIRDDYEFPRLVRPVHRTEFPAAMFERAARWEDAHRANGIKPGRLTEIAMRVALISANANGDLEVTADAMDAGLRFGDWQLSVRNMYAAGDALNQDALLTGLVEDAFVALGQSLAEGKPKMLAGKPIIDRAGWIDLNLLHSANRTWSRKYGRHNVNRAIKAALDAHMIEQLEVPDSDKPNARPLKLPKYRLIKN